MSQKPAFKPYPYAYFEDNIVPTSEANISIMTNALHYGIGVFGGIKAFKSNDGLVIFRLDDHLARMQRSVKSLGFPYKFDELKVKQKILELSRKNNIADITYIRPIIYRSDTNISPDIAGDYSLAIYMLERPNYVDTTKGLRVSVSSWQRNSDKTIPPLTKATGGYINSALAIYEAHQRGFDSAVMLDKNGDVSEGAVMNLFIVKNSKLVTPSLDSDILEGITRRTVLELAGELSIPVVERKVKQEELYDADEIFFCGTATDIAWCSTIDHADISTTPGTITKKLTQAFLALPRTHPELFTKITK